MIHGRAMVLNAGEWLSTQAEADQIFEESGIASPDSWPHVGGGAAESKFGGSHHLHHITKHCKFLSICLRSGQTCISTYKGLEKAHQYIRHNQNN